MSDNHCSPVIDDIAAELQKKECSAIVYWNRIEGWPRSPDFKRALKAEVRDALWMLTRQWQMGEFQGDDAGSPIAAKIHLATTPLSKYQPGKDGVQPFPKELPLEALVEQQPIPLGLDLRLQMGRQWLKLIRKVMGPELGPELIAELVRSFILAFPIAPPEEATIRAHPEVLAHFQAVADRAMDGAALYAYLKKGAASHAFDKVHIVSKNGEQELTNDQKNTIDSLADRFMRWFESLYAQPPEGKNSAWKPSHLEYQFACSVPNGGGEKVYIADEYYHGHLDWYNLDIDPVGVALGETNAIPPTPTAHTSSFFPAPISYDGMPNTRWWTFEDGFTNFGDIRPDTIDLAKLLLIEFGLVYANDWFLFPFAMDAGNIAQVKGLALTNVFGERFWIKAANKGSDEDWQRWSMFTTSTRGSVDVPAEMSIVMLPTVPKIQEGSPLEEVVLIRDEVANMVWGIEKTVPLPDGRSRRGSEVADELHSYLQRKIEELYASKPEPETETVHKASIRYQVMNTVPENWIPFIPVHVEHDIRQVQLQRAAMPRILKGDQEEPIRIRPRTGLLREGLDASPPKTYYVHEEEVPRVGARATKSFQRTRWYDGKVVVWVGVRKGTGRGEGSSGLAFDQIIPVP